MEESIEARVPPDAVWKAWERAHSLYGQQGIEEGQKGKAKFRYQVLDVLKGERFTILWKTFFVRLIFTQTVKPTFRGSKISYQLEIKGLFAWLVRFIIGKKIQNNIRGVLQAVVKQLEERDIH